MLFVYLAAPEFKLVHLAQQRPEEQQRLEERKRPGEAEQHGGNPHQRRQRRSLPAQGERNSQIEIQRAHRAAPVAVIMRTV